MDATPSNRMQGGLPENQTGQPYKFADAITEAREALAKADKAFDVWQSGRSFLNSGAHQRNIESYLREAERMIELARKVML